MFVSHIITLAVVILGSNVVESFICLSASPKITKIDTKLRALFDDDDTSDFDALLRFGPAPFITRITQREKYEAAVEKFQRKEGCSKVEAVRNMDAYFSDPDGWVLSRGRIEKYGEKIDYTKKSGVQKRPIFSTFWAVFIFWFFLIFLPTRVQELDNSSKPKAFEGGFCMPDVRYYDEKGKQQFKCKRVDLFNDPVMYDKSK